MITFKQFITEARMAPLYHGTSSNRLESIIKDGLVPHTYHKPSRLLKKSGNAKIAVSSQNYWEDDEIIDIIKGVSTSRSFKFAMEFAKKRSRSGFVIFELDQQKLAHRYQIKPIQYFSDDYGVARFQRRDRHDKNEAEEYIITTKNIPLTFVTTIHYSIETRLGLHDDEVDALKQAKKKYPHIKFKAVPGSTEFDLV